MDFSQSEEQAMIAGTIARFVERRYGANEQRAYRAEPAGYDAENFARLAEMGLFALPLSEQAGGMGAGAGDVMVMMEALGRGLVVEPVLTRTLIAARLLDRAGSDAARGEWLEAIATGERSVALAYGESLPTLRDGHLSGTRALVLDAPGADALVVPCSDPHKAAKLALVPVGAEGLTLTPFRLADGSWAADAAFDAVSVDPAQVADCPVGVLADVLLEAAVGAAAEMVGIMQRLLEDAVAYVQTRQQFGQPLGKFQAVQHRAARMFVALEQSRSLLLKAALTAPDHPQWALNIHSCRAFAAAVALDLAHDAVQLHGGIGITDEAAVSFGHRRIMVLRMLFADGGPFALPSGPSRAEAA